MTHEWSAGVLTSSSWHGLENIGAMPDASAMIAAGENVGAWPVAVDSSDMATVCGLPAPDCKAIVGTYRDGSRKVLGVNGNRYRAVGPDAWRDLVTAATLAGGQPTGAFALRGHSRVLATFDLNGVGTSGIRTQLVIVDAFDGSMKLTVGTTSVRVVCANTLRVAMTSDGDGMAALRHTASLETKVGALKDAIATAVASGAKLRDTFAAASATTLQNGTAKAAFDRLFPEAPKDASPALVTRLNNARDDARRAAQLPINRVGGPGNLANLWNAATYLVDRKVDGSARDVRGGDMLDSMLFGTRAQRIQEIEETIIEVLTRDGKAVPMKASAALAAGVDPGQVGRTVLADMLGE